VSAAAALVVAGPPAAALEAALGEERAAAVRDVLVRRTLAVARAAAARVETAGSVAAAATLGPGPLLVLPSICPRLGAVHVAAALADLEAGCDAAYGPTLDGDWYLAALAAPRLELLSGSPFAVAREHAVEVGLVRHERALRTAADAAAFRADPLTPRDVRAVLGGG
jgi:glycosyltransferase A (GT-A) superfamily protein (DUF2064 family)